MEKDQSVRISNSAYKKITKKAKSERRSIKTMIDIIVEYFHKGDKK